MNWHSSILLLLLGTSCADPVENEIKVFHAGPSESGFGGVYFELFTNNYYRFCQGNFLEPGCYTGKYSLHGDTLEFHGLRLNSKIRSKRFVIKRYADQDSTYWQWKYPTDANNWRQWKVSDLTRGSDGDILQLDESDKIIFNERDYLIIRLDSLSL